MELRQALDALPDVAILYVLPDNQVNEKSLFFARGNDLTARVTFLRDRRSAAIDRLGLRRPNPEAIEEGVPHPTTYLLDEQGVIQLVDIREDYHIWLDASVLLEALSGGG